MNLTEMMNMAASMEAKGVKPDWKDLALKMYQGAVEIEGRLTGRCEELEKKTEELQAAYDSCICRETGGCAVPDNIVDITPACDPEK